MVRTRALTFQDILTYYEGNAAQPNFSLGEYPSIQKAIINTGQGLGVWNPIYGAQAWYMLNTESNWFAAMPKLTWDKSGFRTVNGFTRTASTMAISETASLPTPTIPNINVIKITPKIAANTFETSQVVQQLASESMDDIYGNLDVIRNFYATEHIKLLNEQIGQKAVGTTAATSISGAGRLQFESIDRIISSYPEAVAAGLTGSTAIGNVINPWLGALNRGKGPSVYDAYVVSGSTALETNVNGTFTASTTKLAPAALAINTLNATIQGAAINGANSNVVMTGYNTYASIVNLFQNPVRYFPMSETLVKFDLNGIESGEGVIGGVQVATVFGLPLIKAVNTPSSGAGTGKYENVYFLDTTDTEGYGYGRLGVQVLNPTTYLETTGKDFLLLQQLAYEGMYYTIGENVSRFMGAQAKIRDIIA
jgi:hypothetical protein